MWNPVDIWHYIKKEKIPVISIYFSKPGKRYRNIGCEVCCNPIESKAATITKIIKEPEKDSAQNNLEDINDTYTIRKLKSEKKTI